MPSDRAFLPLDAEEEALMKLSQLGDTISDKKNIPAIIQAAQEHTKKQKVNIGINMVALTNIKHKANEYGMPYQTLINVVLQQFAQGKIQVSL